MVVIVRMIAINALDQRQDLLFHRVHPHLHSLLHPGHLLVEFLDHVDYIIVGSLTYDTLTGRTTERDDGDKSDKRRRHDVL